MNSCTLQIEKLFDSVILSRNGLLHSSLKLDEMRAWDPSDFGAEDVVSHIPGYENLSFADFMNYENTGMVQGVFLSAMCSKYRVTGDSDSLKKATRTFQGILHVYEISQSIAPGFYCKPWGGKATNETSSDQYIYTMYGLDDYFSLASPQEQEKIREMIVSMTAFWLDRNYDWNYYGVPLHWRKCRFISFMALAVKHGGGLRFQTELDRLIELQKNDSSTPFQSTLKEGARDGKHLSVVPESGLSTFHSIEKAMQTQNCPRFMEICRDSMEYGKTGLAGDGTSYGPMVMDETTGKWRELKVSETTYKTCRCQSPIYGLYGPYRKGGMQVIMFAHFALAFSDYDKECGGREFAENIMQQIGTSHLTWYEDPYQLFPKEISWMSNVFSGDAAANWLWCYWKLKEKNMAEKKNSGESHAI